MANYAIGAVGGLLFLLIYARLPRADFIDAAYTAFAIMAAIYVGAHLVTSDTARIVYEAIGASVAIGGALLLRDKWPAGLGLLIFCHGGYDLMLGHSAGVASWYPPLCGAFDIIVGLGTFFVLMHRPAKSSATSSAASSAKSPLDQ